MSPGTNAPASLTRQFKPVLSQAFIVELWIEANDQYWGPQYDMPLGDHFLAFETTMRRWHKHTPGGGYPKNGWWECGDDCEPFGDYKSLAFFDLARLLSPLIETASPADQRKLGSYSFMNGVIRLLERTERVCITTHDLCKLPRPLLEEKMESERYG